jgi:hypothetical protein
VLYGLNALYATALLVVGWYLAGLAQGFVSRAMTITHQIDALVTAFVASLARTAVLAVVGIAVLQLFGIQTASLVAVLGATSARDRPSSAGHAFSLRRGSHAAIVPLLPDRRRGRSCGKIRQSPITFVIHD